MPVTKTPLKLQCVVKYDMSPAIFSGIRAPMIPDPQQHQLQGT